VKAVHVVTFVLTVVGALNWGLVALFNLNLVTALLGAGAVEKAVYVLVAVSAVYLTATHKSDCKTCAGGK
jgi:hypothetical protein